MAPSPSSSINAGPASHVPGCFVDLCELPRQHGKLRRLYGPAEYIALRGRGATWGVRVESVAVGPTTYALWYDQRDPERICLWLRPGEVIDDWAKAGLSATMDSLRLLDRPPNPSDPCAGVYYAKR
jgi:hypothetical protein